MAEDRADTDMTRLVAEHLKAVHSYAFRLTGSELEAEDLTQQVFLIAQERYQQLRCPEAARGWLFSILRNRFFKTLKRPEEVLATTLGIDLESLPELESDATIDQELLQIALDELPAEFRVVLVMFYFEDCSYKEIAESLGLPLGTVMSRLARAKSHLRTRLFRVQPQACSTEDSRRAPGG